MIKTKRVCLELSITPLLAALLLLFTTTTALGLTDDLTDDFLFGNFPTDRFCPADTLHSAAVPGGLDVGDTAAVWADVDGVDDLHPFYGRYEVQVVISTVRGEMYSVPDSSGIKQLFYSFFETNCGEDNCSVDNTCDRGRLVMRFVNLRGTGVVWNDPATWAGNYMQIQHVQFKISADYCYDYDDPKFVVTPPYQQARAYRSINLTDFIGSCDGGNCVFDDATGIAEVFVTTDFCENILDDLMLDGTAAASNTPAGVNVTVPVGNATVSFDNVATEGNTTLTEASTGSSLPPNFALCDPPIYYNIETTATYAGNIEVCINYPESCDESNLSLLHEDAGTWTDVTTSLDTLNNVICGEVSSLSEFAIGTEMDMVDTIPPTCTLASEAPGIIQISIQDQGPAGLCSINALVADNAVVTVPPFTPETNDPVIVTAERINPEVPATVELVSSDCAGTGNTTTCQFLIEPEPVCSCPGDLDNDADVDMGDVGLFRAVIGTATGDAGFNPCADFDNDGRITMNDYRILRTLYGNNCIPD